MNQIVDEKTQRRPWTPEEIEALQQPDVDLEELAQKLGRTVGALKGRLSYLRQQEKKRQIQDGASPPPKKEPLPSEKNLADEEAEARRQGMSYGQLQAKKRLEEKVEEARAREIFKDDLNQLETKIRQVEDPVNHPSHYTDGSIEVIDYIEDKELDFCLGNAVKYISRAGKKGDAAEDLKKAVWYLERKIQRLEEVREDG